MLYLFSGADIAQQQNALFRTLNYDGICTVKTKYRKFPIDVLRNNTSALRLLERLAVSVAAVDPNVGKLSTKIWDFV